MMNKCAILLAFCVLALSMGCKSDDAAQVDAPTPAAPVETVEAPEAPVVVEDGDEVEPAAVVVAAPVDLVAMMANPLEVVGKEMSGTVYVDDVISDRGFYVTDGKQRVFAVVREDTPKHEMIDIDKGQKISFRGLLMEQKMMADLTGELEQDTKDAIMAAPYFIAMHHSDVKILEQDATPPSKM